MPDEAFQEIGLARPVILPDMMVEEEAVEAGDEEASDEEEPSSAFWVMLKSFLTSSFR